MATIHRGWTFIPTNSLSPSVSGNSLCLRPVVINFPRTRLLFSGTNVNRSFRHWEPECNFLYVRCEAIAQAEHLSKGDDDSEDNVNVGKSRRQGPQAIAKANTKKKKAKSVPTEPSCYGCGAPLQTVEVDAPGYVMPETYELKKKHHQLRSVLCGRCRLLSHGHMVTAVGGHGGYSGGRQFISAEQLREKLCHLRHEKALIIKLVDIADFNGSFLARVRDLVGANPIILVVTKVDLLPKGTDVHAVGDWIVEATMRKRLNVLSIHLTSSKSMLGIVGVVSEIQQQRKGRNVYILGSANVGKSAFISALLKTMALKDPIAAAARRYKPIQSAVPGTTLGPIEINAFHGGGKLYDTPGVHLHHRQASVVHSEDLPLLAPQSRLKGCVVPVDAWTKENELLDVGNDSKARTNDLNGLSIFWGGLVRIDVLKVPLHTRLTVYGPKAVQVQVVPTSEAEQFYQEELGGALIPPTGKEKAKVWPGLQSIHPIDVKVEHKDRPICDIAVSGLGWIAVEPGFCTAMTGAVDLDILSEADKQLHLLVHVPKPVEVFVRPPMPIGRTGAEWYEYSELTENDEQTRPKLFC